jgi:hypothetical protein
MNVMNTESLLAPGLCSKHPAAPAAIAARGVSRSPAVRWRCRHAGVQAAAWAAQLRFRLPSRGAHCGCCCACKPEYSEGQPKAAALAASGGWQRRTP